jgi:hypothetical protein
MQEWIMQLSVWYLNTKRNALEPLNYLPQRQDAKAFWYRYKTPAHNNIFPALPLPTR